MEFRELVDAVPGRYRLDPLDEHRRVVANVAAAYVTLTEPPRSAAGPSAAGEDRDLVIRELVRAHADMVKAMSERFSNVMQAAAELLRAADGAGLPARPPMAVVDGEEDDDDEEDDEQLEVPAPAAPAPGLDLNALVAQIVPMVIGSIASGKLDLSRLGEMFDWRKAAASGKAAANANTSSTAARAEAAPAGAAAGAASSAPEESPGATGAGEAGGPPPLDAAAMVHFLAIQSALTPEEGAMARGIAKELSPADMRVWFQELSSLAVPDAVAKIRTILGTKPAGAAGGAAA